MRVAQIRQDREHASVVLIGAGTSSLRKMLRMCESTVFSVSTNRCAIAPFVLPSAISARTSRSRALS
jgi:hypothetical protein